MKNIYKNIIKSFPPTLRKKITQNTLNLYELHNTIQFKVADSIEELEQAFQLLHNSYVKAGFMEFSSEKIRIIPQFLFPSTTIFVAKDGKKVIGTSSLIQDNKIGLPMEKIFDISYLRSEGSRLTEVSSLALHSDYRTKGGLIFHHFIRYLWNYALDKLNCETFVITVNPSMVQFYEDIYLFQKIANNSNHATYDFVNGAPAVGLFNKINKSKEEFHKEYINKEKNKNLYSFLFDPNFLGKENINSSLYFDINSKSSNIPITQYFLDSYSQWWNKLDITEKYQFVTSQIALGRKSINYPELYLTPNHRVQPRFDTSLKFLENGNTRGIIFDASMEGIKIRNLAYNRNKSTHFIACQLGPNNIARLKLEPKWEKNYYTGFQILDADSEWVTYINYIKDTILGETIANQKKSS